VLHLDNASKYGIIFKNNKFAYIGCETQNNLIIIEQMTGMGS